MFKGMHPVFWIGLAIMYVFAAVFMLAEMLSPGMTYTGVGVAPAFYYQTFGLLVLNLFLGWLWYYVPEQVEKKKELEKGVTKNGS